MRIGTLAMSFASLSAPLAVVSIINGTQPFIMLIFGGLFTAFLPHIISEQHGRTRLVHPILSSAVIFTGFVFLFIPYEGKYPAALLRMCRRETGTGSRVKPGMTEW